MERRRQLPYAMNSSYDVLYVVDAGNQSVQILNGSLVEGVFIHRLGCSRLIELMTRRLSLDETVFSGPSLCSNRMGCERSGNGSLV